MNDKTKIADVAGYLPAGAVEMGGVMGKRLNRSIENRVKTINYRHLVDPFRQRNEIDGMWRCEFWGKNVYGAIMSWRATQDSDLKILIAATVKDLISTQPSDGGISSYPPEFAGQGWDIWGRKYVMLALAKYWLEIERDDAVVHALIAHTDCLMRQVGPDGSDILACGMHDGMAASSILEPVLLVYRITGEPRYLDYAQWIVSRGGSQQHDIFQAAARGVPPRYIGNGKAYEMMSCFEGLAELYRITGQDEYLQSLRTLWQSIAEREILITGVGGSRDPWGEFWGDGHFSQFKKDSEYIGETCVTSTWITFSLQLLRLTGDCRIADEIEKSYYNGLAGAMRHDGHWWMHLNPSPLNGLGFKQPAFDQIPGFGEDCCAAQGPKALAFFPAAMAMSDRTGGLFVNFFEPAKITFDDAAAMLEIGGNYPYSGTIPMRLSLKRDAEFTLHIRIPGWCAEPELKVNGKTVPTTAGTYAELRRRWHHGDQLELTLPMPIRTIPAFDASPRFALMRGPLLLVQESRVGKVNVPFQPVGGAEVEAPDGIEFAWRFADGMTVCDYASAGNTFDSLIKLCVWMPLA